MINNTFLDYVTIRVSIFALRLVAPASIGYLLCCSTVKPEWWNLPLGVVAAAEASFYLFVYLPRTRRLQAPPTNPAPTLTRAQRQLIFTKCIEAGHLDEPHTQQHQPYPTGWFLPPNSPTGPTREDTIDWLLWALFSSSREELGSAVEEEHKDELEGYVKEIQRVLGRELDSGQSGLRAVHAGSDVKGIRSMRITLDPVRMLHRPLIWYFIVAAVDTYTTLRLISLGFRHYTPRAAQWRLCFPPRPVLALLSLFRVNSRESQAPEGVALPYWYRPHRSKTKMPVVFLHGIGIGLYPYIPFIRSIISGSKSTDTGNENSNEDGAIGILLPELLPISMHMTPRSVPPRAVMLASLDLILGSLKDLEGLEQSHEVDHEAGAEDGDGEAGIRRPLLSNPNADNVDFGSCSSLGNATATSQLTQKTGWHRVVLAAHSYGTFVAGWIVRQCMDEDIVDGSVFAPSTTADAQHPSLPPPHAAAATAPHTQTQSRLCQKIAHLILVDPIPILLSHPAVAHNFLYRHPSSVCPRRLGSADNLNADLEELELNLDRDPEDHVGTPLPVTTPMPSAKSNIDNTNGHVPAVFSAPSTRTSTPKAKSKSKSWFSYSSAAAWQLYYFASRDADVARTLCRAFFWAEGGIWREEIGVFLGARGEGIAKGQKQKGRNGRGKNGGGRNGKDGSGSGKSRNMAVILGGKDQIVPAEAIRRYLTREERWSERWAGGVDVDVGVGVGGVSKSHGVSAKPQEDEVEIEGEEKSDRGKLEVLFNPLLDHAVIFDHERWTEPLLEVVRRYVGDV